MTTMMPELARSATAQDLPELSRRFRLGLRYLVLLMLPAAALFVTLAQPMLGVLVRGGFGAHDASVTADTLQAMAIGLVPFSLYLYSLRAFYALHDTFTPFWINTIENGANVVLALVLFPSLGVQGLAWAWAGAYTLAAVLAAGRAGPAGARCRSTATSAPPPPGPPRAPRCSRSSPRVLAAAIGSASANRALVATGIAGLLAGGRVRGGAAWRCARPSSVRCSPCCAAAPRSTP